MEPVDTIHGTALVLDETGVLLRGASGAGKSILALALIERWQLRGRPAVLVADDRVGLTHEPDRVVMHAPASISGMVELRGRGVVERPFRVRATLHLVVDLVAELERMPMPEAFATTLAGHVLARCPVPRAGLVPLEHQFLLIDAALAATDPANAGGARPPG